MSNVAKSQPAYLVLGAAGGVGTATARRLSTEGHPLLLAGRPSERLTSLADELSVPWVELDATSTEEVEQAFTRAVDEFGALAGVVNCVGSLLLKPAHLTSDDDWDTTINTNLRSAFATVKAAAKTMRRSGGSVVLVSSAAARLGFANHEAIAAAKAGVIGLTLSASATYAANRIRVNAVAPGLVKTPLTASIWSKEQAAKASEEMHALGRLGEPDDIASAICWLLDPTNSWITGEVISIDGGLSQVRPTVRRKPG